MRRLNPLTWTRSTISLSATLALVISTGCSSKPPEPADNDASPTTTTAAPADTGESVAADETNSEDVAKYQAVSFDDLPATLEAHKGKVVILDLWATW